MESLGHNPGTVVQSPPSPFAEVDLAPREPGPGGKGDRPASDKRTLGELPTLIAATGPSQRRGFFSWRWPWWPRSSRSRDATHLESLAALRYRRRPEHNYRAQGARREG